MTHIVFNDRHVPSLTERIGAHLREWRCLLRRVHSEYELSRRLEGYEDHLLRDMGLVRDGDRISWIDPRHSPWR